VRDRRDSGAATFRVLREMGIFGPGVPTLREITDAGQRTVEELVDRYPIACRPVRDLIVEYLKERQPSIDYVTLRNRASELARSFWADLEQHHPGIGSLRLPHDVAAAWKQRLRTRTTAAASASGTTTTVTVERLSYLDTLASVRAFYLDLSEWALEDPARWGPWVAPCPVRAEDLERRKFTRRRKARMDARTRDRLPVLPILARAALQWRDDAGAVLPAARDAEPAGDHAGRWQAICHGYRRWSLGNPGDFALIFGTPAPGYQAPASLTGPAAASFAAVPFGVYAAAVQAGAADPERSQIPGALAAGPLLQDLLGEGGPGLPPRLAGIALSAWASVLGFLTLEIFGSLTRLITDTDELYRAHVRTVMLGMGFDPDLTSTRRTRSASPGRSSVHGA